MVEAKDQEPAKKPKLDENKENKPQAKPGVKVAKPMFISQIKSRVS